MAETIGWKTENKSREKIDKVCFFQLHAPKVGLAV